MDDNNKEPKEQNFKESNLVDELKKTKKINNCEEMNIIMKELNEKAQVMDLSILQKFAVLFYSYYNHLTCTEQSNKKFIELSTFMINNFQKKKIQILVQNEIIKHFSKDFKNYKIFDSTADKDPVQICFSIVLLSKNIEIMEKFFDKYLNVKIFDSNEYQTLNLGNPVTSTLFDTLFNKVYEKLKNNEKENLDLVIKECIDDSNISVFNLFRCQKCYDIMLINLDKNNNFEMKCLNCDKNYREFTDLQISNSIFSKFYCIT